MAGKQEFRKHSIGICNLVLVSPTNERVVPLCLICEQIFSNETMKPPRMKEHFIKEKPEKHWI